MKKLLTEFKNFAVKGNVVDMAIGVVVGGAFGKIVTSLVNDVFTPIISLIIGTVNFTDLKYTVQRYSSNGEVLGTVDICYGNFIQNIIDFLLVALCLFAVIKLINSLKKKEEKQPEPTTPKLSDEAKLLSEIKTILESKKEA